MSSPPLNPSQSCIGMAFARCPVLAVKSLEEFLDGLLDEELDVLVQLPGTPGQVMAAQFTYYVRSSITLAEALRRDTRQFQPLIDALHRLPQAKPECSASVEEP